MKNLLKILLSLILITSYWWSFALLEHWGKTGQIELQILTGVPFLILSVIGAILGAVLLIKTLVKKDRKII